MNARHLSHAARVFRRPTHCFLSACIILLVLSGCIKSGTAETSLPRKTANPVSANMIGSSYRAGDQLSEQLEKSFPNREHAIAAASFVNVDSLGQSSTFGKAVSQQITTRLFQNGFALIELRMRENTVFVREKEGEFVLSRQLAHIRKKHDIEAFLVGTYSIIHRDVYINARIVHAKDHTILASHDYAIRLTPGIDRMLHAGRR